MTVDAEILARVNKNVKGWLMSRLFDCISLYSILSVYVSFKIKMILSFKMYNENVEFSDYKIKFYTLII